MNRNLAVGLGIALALHVGVAVALSRIEPDRSSRTLSVLVEVETLQHKSPPLPPPPPRKTEEPKPPEPDPQVKPEPKPEVRPEPKPEPRPEPPPPRRARREPPQAQRAVRVRDVADTSFSDEGEWALENRPDNPEATEGPVVVGASNDPVVEEAPPPPPPPPPRPQGSTGVAAATPRRPAAPAFRPVSEVMRPPAVEEEVHAGYPEEARRDGIQGTVRLLVMIRRDGTVYSVRILEDPGGGLGEAAKEALMRFRFRPAIGPAGDPVDYQIYYTYRFVLDS